MHAKLSNKKWIIKDPVPPDVLPELMHYHPLMQRLLYHRGCTTKEMAEAYIARECLHDTSPFLISDMEKAVDRILFGIKSKEKIAIYGDYDADGVTSVALLFSALKALDADVICYIPDRFEEGYGINIQALDKMKDQGIKLIITVDNGIRSLDEVEYATNKLNIDVIVTDHHHPLQDTPRAIAVIDPKKEGDRYPYKDLAGVGVAYKLLEALQICLQKQRYNADIAQDLGNALLEYVALGTVADVVPLVGENRFLVYKGLDSINCTQKVGLNALMNVSKLKKGSISAYSLGFILGPRINAAGRIENAHEALHLLLEEDEFTALELAGRLEEKNTVRKLLTDEMVSQAEDLIMDDLEKAPIIFVYREGFNSGLVGLAAAKLVEKYYCPVIVGEMKDDYLRASCRSIAGFHITKALDECMDLLVRHGGHASAAGFTAHKDKIRELKERLQFIAKRELSSVDLIPRVYVDEEIDLSTLSPRVLSEYYHMVKILEPTGQQNEEALFLSTNVPIKKRRIFGDNNLRLTIKCNSWVMDAVGFGMADSIGEDDNTCDMVYTIGVDHYHQSLYLKIKDIRPSTL